MKAIFDGVRYDTDKATLIGETDALSHGVDSTTDFTYWEAGLYVTPRARRYFLAGGGGPMTAWSKSIGNNSYSGGAGIIPMSATDAREWAERYLPVDVVEAHFGSEIEDA